MNNQNPFNPERNIFRWGPVPGKFLYVSAFVQTHYQDFRAVYGENWSETLWLFKDGRMFWVNETPAVEAAGEKVFVRYLLPTETREKIYKEWSECVQEVTNTEEKISSSDLSTISDKELGLLWKDFYNLYIKFWVSGSIPELANYGSISYLTKKLSKHVNNQQEIHDALEVLTAPTKISFYQEEEIDLVKTKDITKHQEQYYWLKNSYAGTQVLPVEFFAEHKKEIDFDVAAHVEEKIAQTSSRKKELQKKYNLSDEVMEIAKAISDGIGWQDERKKHIFIILHFIDVLVEEIARRFGYDKNELHDLWHNQINDVIAGKDLHPEITKRATGFGVHFFHECEELTSQEVTDLWALYGTEKNAIVSNELKGIVASKGKGEPVRGRVHILLDPMKAESFQDGEVLVAPMTSPEYAFAMKKSCAVVTDTGGLTSHAAIVSRELGIPCVVGAKVATTIFKDGDMVEINPQNGIVKKV